MLEIYSTLADAVAASIPPQVQMVELLGCATVGDSVHRPRYVRIGASTPQAGVFRAPTGAEQPASDAGNVPGVFQRRGLHGRLQAISNRLNTVAGKGSDRGGVVIDFDPRRQYAIWPAGTTSFLVTLLNVYGVTWNFNGAKFTTNKSVRAAGLGLRFVPAGLLWDHLQQPGL